MRFSMGVSNISLILVIFIHWCFIFNYRTDACNAAVGPVANRYILTVNAPQPITPAQQASLTTEVQQRLNQIFTAQGFPKPVIPTGPPTFLSSTVGTVPFSVVGAPLTIDEALLARGLAAAFLSQQLNQPISVDNLSITQTQQFLRRL